MGLRSRYSAAAGGGEGEGAGVAGAARGCSSQPSCSAKVNKHLGLTADAGQWGSSSVDERSPVPAAALPLPLPPAPAPMCAQGALYALCVKCTPCTWPSAQSCLHFLRQDIRGMTKHEANKTKAVNSGPVAGAGAGAGVVVVVGAGDLKNAAATKTFGQKLWSSISSGQSPRVESGLSKLTKVD